MHVVFLFLAFNEGLRIKKEEKPQQGDRHITGNGLLHNN